MSELPDENVLIHISDNPFEQDKIRFADVISNEARTLWNGLLFGRQLSSLTRQLVNAFAAMRRTSQQLVGYLAIRRVRDQIKGELSRLRNMNIAFWEVTLRASKAPFHLFLEDDAVLSSQKASKSFLSELPNIDTWMGSLNREQIVINLSRSFTLEQLGVRELIQVSRLKDLTFSVSDRPKLNTTCAFLIDSTTLQGFGNYLGGLVQESSSHYQAIDATLAEYLRRHDVSTFFAEPEPFIQASMHEAPESGL